MALFTKKGGSKQEQKAGARKTHARVKMAEGGAAHDLIRAPWFSEKALLQTEKGVYAFAVPARATKAEVAGAIKEVYNVQPRMVHIVNLPGKKKAMRTKRGVGQRAARRKAYVYLNAGDTIQFA
ncbi:MAG: 50S ribosomal protein L23 [Patescibacteria group bacterium]